MEGGASEGDGKLQLHVADSALRFAGVALLKRGRDQGVYTWTQRGSNIEGLFELPFLRALHSQEVTQAKNGRPRLS